MSNRTKIDWSRVDWELPDAEIARRVDVSRERVRQIRCIDGHPQSPHKHRHHFEGSSSAFVQETAKLKANIRACLETNPHFYNTELSAFFETSDKTVADVRSEMGLENNSHERSRNPVYDLMDWRLSNRDLGLIWNMPATSLGARRHNSRKGAPVWDARRRPDCPERNRAIEQQKTMAEGWIVSRHAKKETV